MVGPEASLVSGLVNDLSEAGIPAFGPTSKAAALEGSKNFMKSLCDKYGIPTAKAPPAAKQYIQEQGAPIVIKADVLAAGKGAIVARTDRISRPPIRITYVRRRLRKKLGTEEGRAKLAETESNQGAELGGSKKADVEDVTIEVAQRMTKRMNHVQGVPSEDCWSVGFGK